MRKLNSFPLYFKGGFVFVGMLTLSSLSAQSIIEENKNVSESVQQQSISIPTELKQNPDDFYIINDKPVTRQEYLEYLEKKEDRENNSPE